MKNTAKFLLFVAIFPVLILQSCNKELDALPKDSKVYEVTILDQATAQIALNGAYYSFANASRVKTNWQYHQVAPAIMSGYLGDGYRPDNFEENQNEGITYYWNESYILLNNVNGVINGIEKLAENKFTGQRKSEMLGEAHFLRAYAHFKLLSYYGQWFKMDSPYGVLLRDELSTVSNISKARSTVKQSYDFILADLDYAIANSPDKNEKFYATKWAAMLLKMRVLMSRGQSGDYNEITSLADKILAGPYKLEDNPKNIFQSKGMASDEVILAIQPQPQQETDFYSKSKQYWPGASFLFVAKPQFLQLLKDDPRALWLVGNKNPALTNTYFFNKYIKEGGIPSQISETDYVIRLTEVYLLKAEAIVRSNGNFEEAKELVHIIQSKSGVTATENNQHYLDLENTSNRSDLLLEIYKETARSLVAEDGMEWLALLRLPLATVTSIKPTLREEAQFIFPVPPDEFKYNPAFGEQNPGYSKN